MAKGPTKARPTRVNIVISDGLKGKAEPELPFRVLVMGDFTQKQDKRAIYDRGEPENVNKTNFDAVMQKMNLALDLTVANRITGDGEMPVSLKFGNLNDFRPESIARQVPQLRNLVELRDALKALKNPLRDKAAQKKILDAIKDPVVKEQVLKMIASPTGSEETPT